MYFKLESLWIIVHASRITFFHTKKTWSTERQNYWVADEEPLSSKSLTNKRIYNFRFHSCCLEDQIKHYRKTTKTSYSQLLIPQISHNQIEISSQFSLWKYGLQLAPTQTWNLSKNLHRRILRLKILHRQFHLISTVLVGKKHKKWVKMEKFTPLAKILHCRRHWRHGQIPPLS